ncbi:hypothetical protein K440DRAFT_665302 [Wilcoxina mikolae CBS 423.85]|nr:hypothetical protein K440DRAFT_665302 [Wilcoxina mikolae CBS 423.85]
MLPLSFLIQYGAPMSQTLEKRSTGGNAGLSTGETAALVVGAIGVVLTALTVLKGWRCLKSRKKQEIPTPTPTSSPAPAIINHFYLYPPTSSHPRSDISADMPLPLIPTPAPPAPLSSSSDAA